jgi:hypothetical protein
MQTQQQTAIAQPIGYSPVYHFQQPAQSQVAPAKPLNLTWAIALAATVSALGIWFVADSLYGGDRIRALEARVNAAEAISADRGRVIQSVQGVICK